MRVCVLSKSDMTGGGASRVAQDLHKLLISNNYQSEHWLARPGKPLDRDSHLFYGSATKPVLFGTKFLRAMSLGEILPIEFPSLYFGADIFNRFDIVHVHDISSAISPFTLKWISERVPVLWTMHDASSVTGGCLYPNGCQRYMKNCGSCPQRGVWPLRGAFDLTSFHLKARKIAHESGNISLCAPSSWMANLVNESPITNTNCHVLGNAVNTEVFIPAEDKVGLKRKYGLPDDLPAIVLSAGNLSDRRKGTLLGAEALSRMKDVSFSLILVGHENKDLASHLSGIPSISTGFISDETILAEVYAMGDVLLFPSRADNQPLTILEAMACAVPVVGFEVGGIKELLDEGRGVSVKDGDVVALEIALRNVIEHKEYISLGEKSYDYILKNHTMNMFLKKHIHLYEQVISKWKVNNVKKNK